MSRWLNGLHQILICDAAGLNDLFRVIHRAILLLFLLHASIAKASVIIRILELQVLERVQRAYLGILWIGTLWGALGVSTLAIVLLVIIANRDLDRLFALIFVAAGTILDARKLLTFIATV